jgi:hypothetical protein
VDAVAGAVDAAVSLGERVHARAVALRGHAEVALAALGRVDIRGLRSLLRRGRR